MSATPAARVHDDDYAGMLGAVEAELDPDAVRVALGVDDEELANIRAGYVPNGRVVERLLLLYDLSRRADPSSPGELLHASFGAAPRRVGRRALLAFLAADAVLVLGAAVVVLVALD